MVGGVCARVLVAIVGAAGLCMCSERLAQVAQLHVRMPAATNAFVRAPNGGGGANRRTSSRS
eukprot:15436695-Alexandrium_andersonii.AAC.1